MSLQGLAERIEAYHALPAEIQDAARKAYRLFRDNPQHPSLQFKKVHNRQPVYSVRATLAYRASDSSRTTKSPGSGSEATPITIGF